MIAGRFWFHVEIAGKKRFHMFSTIYDNWFYFNHTLQVLARSAYYSKYKNCSPPSFSSSANILRWIVRPCCHKWCFKTFCFWISELVNFQQKSKNCWKLGHFQLSKVINLKDVPLLLSCSAEVWNFLTHPLQCIYVATALQCRICKYLVAFLSRCGLRHVHRNIVTCFICSLTKFDLKLAKFQISGMAKCFRRMPSCLM